MATGGDGMMEGDRGVETGGDRGGMMEGDRGVETGGDRGVEIGWGRD